MLKGFRVRIEQMFNKLRDYLYWNAILRLLLEGTIDYTISLAVNYSYIEYSSGGLSLGLLYTLILTVVYAGLPIWILYIIVKHADEWEDNEDLCKKYAPIVEGMRV